MSNNLWGRAHAAANDFTSKQDAESLIGGYEQAPRWAGYEFKVTESGPGRWCLLARKRGNATSRD